MSVGLNTTEKKPVVSIITVVFNAVNTIEATIQSVINQTYKNIEFIIIDGGSTDGTIAIIQKYRDKISYFVSEPDNGIYEAMNKGIKISKGNWLYFLGADDELINKKTLNSIFGDSSVSKEKNFLIYGDIIYDTGEIHISKLNSDISLGNTIHHQGAFYKRSLFDDFQYDSSIREYADYELNLKIFLSDLPTFNYKGLVAKCFKGGASQQKDFFSHVSYQLQLIRIKRKRLPVDQFLISVLLSLKSFIKEQFLVFIKDLVTLKRLFLNLY
jgi:putative colanic acid biosynthesis glycosyltransferase